MIQHDADISTACTPDKRIYTDPAVHNQIIEKVFAVSWQWVADADAVKVPGATSPHTLLEGSLDEPIVFTRDMDDHVHCLSNVCTHRGTLVCETPSNERFLRCRYHGRRFGMDGTFQFMPEFEGVCGFPSQADSLPKVPFHKWHRFLFASIFPEHKFEDWIGPVDELLGWLPIHEFQHEPAKTRDYLVRGNWALYVDNYLEGFHIPFIHADLNAVLDYGNYAVHKLPHGILQLAEGKSGEACFDLPQTSPHFGRNISAYYFWLFPNLMLNFYPWGLSINVVKPLAVDLTRVSFIGYVWDPSKVEQGAGAGLDRVEREDEAVVEMVQKGLKSRLYSHGRYSVAREDGTHYFHQLLAKSLNS